MTMKRRDEIVLIVVRDMIDFPSEKTITGCLREAVRNEVGNIVLCLERGAHIVSAEFLAFLANVYHYQYQNGGMLTIVDEYGESIVSQHAKSSLYQQVKGKVENFSCRLNKPKEW